LTDGNEDADSTSAFVSRLRPIFEGSSHAMLLIDDDRRYIDCNSAASSLLGLGRDEILRRSVDDVTTELDRDGIEARWKQFLSEGSRSGAVTLKRVGTGTFRVHFSATANVLPGQHLCVLVPVESELLESTPAEESSGTGQPLTAREREVLALIAMGASSGGAASALGVGEETIRTHAGNAMAKLGAHTRAHAIALAMRDGSIELSNGPTPPVGVGRLSGTRRWARG
jgi:PAS domain S-box-containing protein